MAHVEWLRVRNVTRICAIVLGIGFIAAILARIVLQIVMQQHPESVHFSGDYGLDVAGFFPLAMLFGLVVATILGAPLARENSGHLEIAWMRPIAREGLAIRMFGIDIAGIVVVELLTALTELLSSSLLHIPQLTLSTGGILVIAIALVGPIAWYALLTAVTASMRQSYGVALGLAWPVSLAVLLFALIQDPSNPSVQAFHAVMVALWALDPLTYMSMNMVHAQTDAYGGDVQLTSGIPGLMNLEVLVVLSVVYLALAIVQWRRIEA